MINNLSFLPHDSSIVIKDITQKIKYIDLMKKMLEHFLQALNHFENNELNQFDAQVGETLCQIRAYKIYLLKTYDYDFKSKLGLLIEKTKTTISRLVLQAEVFQKHLKTHKSIRPENIKKPICLFEFFSEMDCLFEFSDNALFLHWAYFLCKYHRVDNDNIPIALDFGLISQNINISSSYSKKIGRYYQKSLSEISCLFILSLLNELSTQNILKSVLPLLHLRSDEGRMTLPCYCVTEIILLHMLKIDATITLLIDFPMQQSQTNIALQYKGSCRTQEFEPLDKTDEYPETPCLVFFGTSLIDTPFFKEDFLKQLQTIGIKRLILANNAAHPQFSGSSLQNFRLNPYKTLLDQAESSFTAIQMDSIKQRSNQLCQMKKLAESIGCSDSNQSLFFLKHIFCNTIGAYFNFSKEVDTATIPFKKLQTINASFR